MTLFRMSIFLLFFLGFTLRAEVQQKIQKLILVRHSLKEIKVFFL